jgi:hypothetical protein
MADYELLQLAYTDVTYPVIAGLVQRDDLAEELVLRGEASDSLFLDLATVLLHYEVPALHARFLKVFGKCWRQRLDEVWSRNEWWQPLAVPWGQTR